MNEDFYITLIYKSLSGEISLAERRQLKEWEAASEENRLTIASIKKAWQLSGNLQPEINVDLAKEFDALTARMDEMEMASEASSPTVRQLQADKRRWWSIAAGFALLVAAAFVLQKYQSQNAIADKAAPKMDWLILDSGMKTGQQITLADKSVVTLNENSQLNYPTAFNNAENRVVSIVGEAFFNIQSNPNQPFIVKAGSSEIKVLGTSFNVKAGIDAQELIVSVVEGTVECRGFGDQKPITLSQGQQANFDQRSGRMIRRDMPHLNDLAWYTRQLSFEMTPFQEVIRSIEILYGLKLEVSQSGLQDCLINLKIDNEPIESVFEILRIGYKVEIEANSKNSYQIKGGGC